MVHPASTVVLAALDSHTISPEEAAFFSANPVSGITLFSRNIPDDFRNLSQLTGAVQKLRPGGSPPLLIAIDQEGGRVRRIKDPEFPNLGPAMQIEGGATSPDALAKIARYGKDVGRALKYLGVNVNFAPVVDVLTRPENEAIGDRVFGSEPDAVIKRAGAYLGGLQTEGVLGCLKHFPGQGDAPCDTHVQSAIIDRSRSGLMCREVEPFKNLIPQTQLVMISHCIYPAFDDRPAGMAPAIIQDLLRKELGFTGVVVSDDLLMEAVPQSETRWQSALIEAVLAGVDLLLVCKGLRRIELAVKTLAAEARASKSFALRLEESSERILKLRQSLP